MPAKAWVGAWAGAWATALLAILVVAAGARAQENLDANQSGPKLFSASCAQCHKSARGLAKGRMSFTLSYYLRQHYTSSAQTAQILTAYLQSVDTPPAKAKRAAGKAQPKNAADKSAATSEAPSKASAETSRLPTGTIPPDRPVRPPATVPAR
jgi:mono/diheme cytochrome c family protein